MVPDTNLRTVHSKGVTTSGRFRISETNQAFIMKILRDKIYSDKILAVLREYAANAWDAHREAGKGTVPIHVTLPTVENPELVIRDFGLGMSETEVFERATQYGESSKRTSDDVVGMLGIGFKSGFAYSDSFTVTSWHGGEKSIYVAYLDDTDEGRMNKIHAEPCGEETGLEIKIAAQPADIQSFHDRARTLFRFFEPPPVINIELPKINRSVTQTGFILANDNNGWSERQWVAIMGCIPYKLDLKHVVEDLDQNGLGETFRRVFGGIYFEIGEVHISASREELEYSEKTKKAIVAKINTLFDEYVEDMIACMRREDASGWARRVKIRTTNEMLRVPIPKAYKHLATPYVVLYEGGADKPEKFDLTSATGGGAGKIYVAEETRVFFQDDDRKLAGFGLGMGDAIIRPLGDASRDDILADFQRLCLIHQADGIEVRNLSSLTWQDPSKSQSQKKSKRVANPKHRVRCFQLQPDAHFGNPWSEMWEPVRREPTKDDVFVTLRNFQHEDFPKWYRSDQRLAHALNLEMPPIYGYKDTERKPVDVSKVEGTYYQDWRREFFSKRISDEQRATIADEAWLNTTRWHPGSRFERKAFQRAFTKMTQRLPPDHILLQFFKRLTEARARLTAENRELSMALTRAGVPHGENPQKMVAHILRDYPMFDKSESFAGVLDQPHAWIDYVLAVDDAKLFREMHRAPLTLVQEPADTALDQSA